MLTALTAQFAAVAADNAPAVERPVYAAYTVEAGTSHLAQTYLSPLRYSGAALNLSYERMQAMRFDPQRWVMRLNGSLGGALTYNNPARNSKLWNLDFTVGWGMARRYVSGKWNFYVGGNTALDVGMLYLPRNGNNPVAAKASWTVGLSAGVARTARLWGKSVILRYWGEMPLAGVFFSPDYGEPYYEIYLGNRSGLVRGAWPGNFFRVRNLLSADFVFGRTVVRLGYRLDVFSSKASHIVSRQINHMAVIGFASEWISLSPCRNDVGQAKTISALY